MKFIDAHLHLFPAGAHSDGMARAVGHENSAAHLEAYDRARGGVCGIVMGNGGLELETYNYPEFFRYCVGLDSDFLREGYEPGQAAELVRLHLQRPQCVGVKLYPGYHPTWLSDPMYQPFYRLAQEAGKPVAIHMGMTATPWAKLKYSHPLTLDEVAADWPEVRFVMCHFGNPFLAEAAAVLEKNPNVCADLSGLLEGITDLERYFTVQAGYVALLRTWMAYVDDYSRFLFGTDFPAVNVENYLEFIRRVVPEEHHEAVLFENASRVYHLGL